MTLIEFYDRESVENIVSALSVQIEELEKIIFLMGSKGRVTERQLQNIERILRNRGFEGKIDKRMIPSRDVREIIAALMELVETEEECTFDLTGGEGVFLFALGQVYAASRERGIQVHWFNIATGRIADCDLDGETGTVIRPELTVEENIALHGGEVDDPVAEWPWNDEDFIANVKTMWEICRKNCTLWNSQAMWLAELSASAGEEGKDSLVIDVSVSKLLQRCPHWQLKKYIYEILTPLYRAGIIQGFKHNDSYIFFSFRDPQIKRCLTTSGTVLELMTYVLACEQRRKDGQSVYTDAMTGVKIMWENQEVQEEDGCCPDNEIDVILMNGLVPCFISCKNGRFSMDELYKLNAVADRFGQRLARKALVCAESSKAAESFDSIKARGRAMGITVIGDVAEMDVEEYAKTLKNLAM